MLKKAVCALALGGAMLTMPTVFGADAWSAQQTVTSIKAGAEFPAQPPTKKVDRKIKNAFKEAVWKMSESYDMPLVSEKEKATTITILGQPEVTQRQMVRFIKRRNPQPKLNCTIAEIVRLYYEEGEREGVRPDVALCQAIKETGFFRYGGDVVPEQNNYCGLGTIGGGVKGAFFPSPQIGVRAHIQHLMAYATTRKPSQKIVDPRYEHIVKNRPEFYGAVPTWTGLNGKWAVPGDYYGQDILNLWRQAKAPDDTPETLIYATMDIRRDPKNAAAYLYRGIAYYNGGNYENAIVDYDESLKLAPTVEGYYNRALCYEKIGQLDKAIKDYTKGLELDKEFVNNRYNRGMLYLRQGKYKAAIEDLEQVYDDHPQMANAVNAIGIAHAHMKKYDQAWRDFYNAGKINKQNPIIEANQKIIAACYAAGEKKNKK